MNYFNYSLSSGKAKFYLKEKQPTEGYEEVTYGTDNKKTWHKYVDSIKGLPTYLEQKEITFEGRTLKFLELTLVEGDDAKKLSLPLKNKGGYTDEVKALLSALNGLELGEEVSINPSKSKYTTKAGIEKENLNIYINYTGRLGENGKPMSTGYIQFTDIPKPTSKVVAGDTTWNWEEQTEFYWKKLTDLETKFKNQTTSASTQAPKVAPSKTEGFKQAPQGSTKDAFEPAEHTADNKDFTDLPFN